MVFWFSTEQMGSISGPDRPFLKIILQNHLFHLQVLGFNGSFDLNGQIVSRENV